MIGSIFCVSRLSSKKSPIKKIIIIYRSVCECTVYTCSNNIHHHTKKCTKMHTNKQQKHTDNREPKPKTCERVIIIKNRYKKGHAMDRGWYYWCWYDFKYNTTILQYFNRVTATTVISLFISTLRGLLYLLIDHERHSNFDHTETQERRRWWQRQVQSLLHGNCQQRWLCYYQ